MIREKIIGWIAIGIILAIMGWVHKYDPFTAQQLHVIIATVIGLGIFIRLIALRESRLSVIKRRRMFKEFWRRGELIDSAFDLPEEESIVLLGRIKGGKLMAVIMFTGAIVALYYGRNLFSFVLALGQVFLAGKLYFIARHLDKTLPADTERELPDIPLDENNASKYLVGINMEAFHDFIAPQAALPFWTVEDAEKWLAKCGFRRLSDGRWVCQKNALRYLDTDEIISIETYTYD